MSEPVRLALLAVVGFAVAAGAIVAVPGGVRRRLGVTNHRGAVVPATLGIAVFVASVGAELVALVVTAASGDPVGAVRWALVGGGALVFGAGLADDLRPGGPRGLAGHAREAMRFRFTTGLLKVVAGVAGGAWVVAAAGGRPGWAMAAGVVLVAGSANLWNGLDVAPGRAGKVFLLAGAPLLFFGPPALLARMMGAEAAALWPDLRERGMLGDAGSNLLGFTIGAALYLELGDAGVAAAAVIVVGLNLVAETVTLSKVIAAVPPLRWLDGAGRLPATTPAPPAPATTGESDGHGLR